MPTLAELLGGIDSVVTPAKRRLADLIQNPQAKMQQLTGLLGDQSRDFNRNINMAQDGNELRAAGSVIGNAPQYQQATNNVLQGLMNVMPVGMMVGNTAKTWDAASASKAMELEKAGADPRVIWKDTGMWKGPDGNWRQEITDNTAGWRGDAFQAAYPAQRNGYFGRTEMPLGGAVSHPGLFSAYPDKISCFILF